MGVWIPLLGMTHRGAASLGAEEEAAEGSTEVAAEVDAQKRKQEIVAPRLVVTTPECFAHAMHAPADPAGDRFLRRPASSSAEVLWTNRATGEMKPLLSTGTFAIPTRRRSFTQTRLLGVTADDERLYLAVWRSGRTFDEPPPSADEPFDWTPREPGGREGAVGFALVVFWLADGSQLVDEPLPPLAQVPRETTAVGILKPITRGVEVAGQVLQFNGREVVREN